MKKFINVENSKLIESFSWRTAINSNAQTGTLVLKFKNGNYYSISNVDASDFEGFKNADSKGSYFSKVLKTNYQVDSIEDIDA